MVGPIFNAVFWPAISAFTQGVTAIASAKPLTDAV
jgi:hypothetical protein